MPRLPGLNYGTPLTIDDLSYLETTYTDEFRNRTLAIAGNYRSVGAAYGIVASSDPINAVATTDPLYVVRNANDEMTIDVHPGVCFTQSGMRVELTAAATQVEMARTTLGSQNVVYVEHVVVQDTDTISKTRYNTSEARRTRIADETNPDPLVQTTLRAVAMTDWQNDTLYPPDRRANIVMLAVVSVVPADNPGGQWVSVDLSRTNVTVNRPWFSPVDIAHRSFVGTGSAATPHGIGLNDLSQGDLTLYDQLLNYGMVLGRDRDVPGVPGALCLETITTAGLKTDTTGDVTGKVGQKYVELTRFPVRLLGAYALLDQTNEILVKLMPRSNILLFGPDEILPSAGMRLLYTTVQAGEPLIDSLINDEVQVRQPNTAYEMLISGGRGLSIIQPRFLDQFANERARISLGTAPAIPKRYQVLVDGDGQLLTAPQHILCATKLEDLGTAVFSFETTMLGAARLRVGLQAINLVGSTVVQLRLTGTDVSGNTVTEDTTFTFSNYTLPAVACEETATNWLVTDTVFASAASIQVISRTDDGANGAVCVMADLDPMQTDGIRDACPLANIMWDGARVCRIQDARPVGSRLRVPTDTTPVQIASQTILTTLALTGATDTIELLSEDLRDPRWFRLDDPLRYSKFSDGLESTALPQQPLVESSSLGLGQDRYVSQALRLLGGTGRYVHVTLFGYNAQQHWLNGTDGIVPNLEYRWSTTVNPQAWTAWAEATALSDANGSNYQISIADDTAFKLQLRLKGLVVGVAALQYNP